MRERIVDFFRHLTLILTGVLITLIIIYFLPNKILTHSKDTGVLKYDGEIKIDESGIAASVSKVYDATVMVRNVQKDVVKSTGSGFIYKTDDKYAYVMTNEHVISKNDKLILVLSDDKEIPATALGSDPYLDLAVLRIDKKHAKLVAKLGNSQKSSLGDTIFTVGTPVGYEYRGTVTRGTLSGKDRLVSVNLPNEKWMMRVLQVDAAINPGNSGGPLVNIHGEVIGINSLKLVEDEIEGMGFAIPIEYALEYVDRLEKQEDISWPYLGVWMLNTNDDYQLEQRGIKIDPKYKKGVVIVDLDEAAPAGAAGIKVGDIIVRLETIEVVNAENLKYELYKYQVGDEIEITYIRNNKEYTTKIKLEKKAD